MLEFGKHVFIQTLIVGIYWWILSINKLPTSVKTLHANNLYNKKYCIATSKSKIKSNLWIFKMFFVCFEYLRVKRFSRRKGLSFISWQTISPLFEGRIIYIELFGVECDVYKVKNIYRFPTVPTLIYNIYRFPTVPTLVYNIYRFPTVPTLVYNNICFQQYLP